MSSAHSWLNCNEYLEESTLNHHAANASRCGSRRSSALGTTNSALPQSKQTISSENRKTAGLSMFFKPSRRMPVSALNLSRLIDPHDLQDIYSSDAEPMDSCSKETPMKRRFRDN